MSFNMSHRVFLLMLMLPVIVARESCFRAGHLRVNNTVEVCLSYGSLTWFSVCGSGWDCRDATVACREILNINNPRAIASQSYVSSTTLYRARYECIGSERSMSLCSKYTHFTDCGPGSSTAQAAEVVCYAPRASGCPHHGAIRLVGGETSDTGRLELCYNGEWSAVFTDSGFGYNEAATACRQLGYTDYPRIFTDGRYDSNEYSLISKIKCYGHKNTLLDCKINTTTCKYYSLYTRIPKQIGLRCYNATTQCSDGAVRLVGGRIEQEGRVEVCLKGVWGSVCRYHITMTEVNVMCNSLGYHGNRDTFLNDNLFGNTDGPALRGFDCQGWEQNIAVCFNSSQYRGSNCNYNHWLTAVRCSDFCSDGAVRLVGGPNTTSGIVEFCRHDSLWGLIAESRWTDNNAKVVCKQLGIEGDGAVAVRNASHLFSRPKKLIHLANVYCRGSESVISDCALFTTSSSASIDKMNKAEVAAVRCQVPSPTERQSSTAQSFEEHIACQTPSPTVQQSSNYTQSLPAGVNTSLSTIPSQSASSSIVTPDSTLAVQQSSITSAPSLADVSSTVHQHSTSQHGSPKGTSSSLAIVQQSTSSTVQSLVIVVGSSSAAVVQQSPEISLPTTVQQFTSSAQSPEPVTDLISSSQQLTVLQNSMVIISIIMGLNFIMLLLILGSVTAIAAVFWSHTKNQSGASPSNIPTAENKKM